MNFRWWTLLLLLSLPLARLVISASVPTPERFLRTNLGAPNKIEEISYFIADGTNVPGFESADQALARAREPDLDRADLARARNVLGVERRARARRPLDMKPSHSP